MRVNGAGGGPMVNARPEPISIGLATWNRAALLKRTLESVAALRVPSGLDWEILVADNNCTDATRAVVEAYAKSQAGRINVRYTFEPRQGKPYALNRILREVAHNWIAMIDDDVELAPGWLEAYDTARRRYPDAVCFGGPIELNHVTEPSAHGRFLAEHFPYVFARLDVARDQPMKLPWNLAFGPNMVLRRDKLPPEAYDPKRGMFGRKRIVGEDLWIQRELLEGGGAGWMIADAKVRHHAPREYVTVKQFLRWQAGIGRLFVEGRGQPNRTRFGPEPWLWRVFLKRAAKAALLWRPWPTVPFYKAAAMAAREWGYMHEYAD
jgi:glycosyltransferase involved in cell wall biosynthesis